MLKATKEDLSIIKFIVDETIHKIYPKYYPEEVVAFFQNHHNEENILNDLEKGNVYLLSENNQCIGTGSIDENNINRVFVLPDFQGKGYGSKIMFFLEKLIAFQYDTIQLHSSLPAFKIHLKHGYHPIEYLEEVVDNERVLCYHILEKNVTSKPSNLFDLNNKIFVNKENIGTGEVSQDTIFHYYQQNDIIWATYSGGKIIKGYLIGKFLDPNIIKFTYQHINQEREIRIGECKSHVEKLPNGKIRLNEVWQWLDKDKISGKSILEEIEQ